MMGLPQLSHLQILILHHLKSGDRSGRELREELLKAGQKTGPVAFYRLMARMEDAQLISGRSVNRVINGVGTRERWYQTTAKGKAECQTSVTFYWTLREGSKSLVPS